MIGLVDEVLLFALRRAWSVVANDVAEWRRIFPDYLETEQHRVDDWHKALTAPEQFAGPVDKYVAFGLAELQRPASEHPGMFTRLANARAVADPAGMAGGGAAEDEGYLGLEQSVEIVVLAQSKQLAAALATFALSAVFTSLGPILARSHVSGLSFKDASEIGPMRDLLPERGGAYWYRLRYATVTESRLVAFGSQLLRLPFSIHDVSATDVDGNQGRVTVAARTQEGE
jgi:hypothetical protein